MSRTLTSANHTQPEIATRLRLHKAMLAHTTSQGDIDGSISYAASSVSVASVVSYNGRGNVTTPPTVYSNSTSSVTNSARRREYAWYQYR